MPIPAAAVENILKEQHSWKKSRDKRTKKEYLHTRYDRILKQRGRERKHTHFEINIIIA